jgi:hypothetical protein
MRGRSPCEVIPLTVWGLGEALIRVWCACTGTLRVELECRQEEDDGVEIDLDTASQKSMAKLVNQVSVCLHSGVRIV